MAKNKTAAISEKLLKQFIKLQQQVEEAQKALDELERANPGICQAYFNTLTAKLFEANPRLYSFKWNQYTPSWNDGDACTFSAHTDSPDLNGVSHDDMFYGDGNYTEDYDKEAGGAGEAPLPMNKAEAKALLKNVVDFLRQFKDTQLEHWFGNGSEITCTRKGVTVDDYEGDY